MEPPIVFVHVPRTGGSSFWWYLVSQLKGRLDVLDLHLEAQRLLGHERYATAALAAFLRDMSLSPRRTLIHHHGHAPINAVLASAQYATVIRPPVERLISYFHHVRRMQEVGIQTNEIACHDMSIRDFFERTPWYGRSYCYWFGAMMWAQRNVFPKAHLLDALQPDDILLSEIDSTQGRFVEQLTEFMIKSIWYCFSFEINSDASLLASLLGNQSAEPLQKIVNVGDKNATVSADELSWLKAFSHLDCDLFDALIRFRDTSRILRPSLNVAGAGAT